MCTPVKPPTDTAADFYQAYEGYSRTLRTWLVAYGIGGPVLFLSNEKLWNRVSGSGDAQCVAMLFLAGVALQVFLAALNKTVLWGCYYGEFDDDFKNTRRFSVAHWLAQQFWIDFLIDIASLTLFSLATFELFSVVTSTTPPGTR